MATIKLPQRTPYGLAKRLYQKLRQDASSKEVAILEMFEWAAFNPGGAYIEYSAILDDLKFPAIPNAHTGGTCQRSKCHKSTFLSGSFCHAHFCETQWSKFKSRQKWFHRMLAASCGFWICGSCERVKRIKSFSRLARGYYLNACRLCQHKSWVSNHRGMRERISDNRLRQEFGISLIDYETMLSAQFGKCAICKRPPKNDRRFSVDHCHNSGRVRGLLCDLCNTGIGSLGDSPERLEAAIQYLARHHSGCNPPGSTPQLLRIEPMTANAKSTPITAQTALRISLARSIPESNHLSAVESASKDA